MNSDEMLIPHLKVTFCRGALFHMKTRVSLKYPVNDCRFPEI